MTQNLVNAPPHTKPLFQAESLRRVSSWVAREAEKHEAEAIAGTGHSGLIVAGAVSFLIGIPVIAVRKGNEYSTADFRHANYVLTKHIKQYAIIDDLIDSGHTVARIINTLWHDLGAWPSVILLYNPGLSLSTGWAGKLTPDILARIDQDALKLPIIKRKGR